MLFTEPLFLFYFLPLALILHRLTLLKKKDGVYHNRSRVCFFALTIVFYGSREPWWLIPFFICIGFDFLWASLLERNTRRGWRLCLLWLSVCQNAGLLILFKYWPFLLENLALVSPSVSGSFPLILQDGRPLSLPPGISFYTFESLSFVIDVYQRRIKPPKNPLEFFGFIGMFPRFIAGPIVRYREMVDQFTKYPGMQLERGLYVFALGFFYKTCLADSFSPLTQYAFHSAAKLTFWSAWLGVFSYAMQLYFDFSGYSLMAIGLGWCFGFKFPENFKRPFLSASLQEFWTRWHITLSQWIRDYVFTPLALIGIRRSPKFVYPALMVTMIAFGIWHGSNWTFVLMGVWFGLVLCLETAFSWPASIPKWVCQVRTFAVVLVGWVFLRAEDTAQAFRVLKAMGSAHSANVSLNVEGLLSNPLGLGLCVLAIFYCFIGESRWDLRRLEQANPVVRAAVGFTLMVFSLLLAYSAEKIPFLYFQF